MARIEGVWALCVAVVGLAACAEGVTTDSTAVRMPGVQGAPARLDGGVPMAPAASGGSGGSGVYTGEPCQMGDTADCSCSSGGEGTKVCRYDMKSPTKGTFSECMACMTPPPQSDDSPGDVSVRDAGAAGRSGMQQGGTGGQSGATAGRAGGSAGSGEGGSGGTSQPTMPRPSGSRCNPPCTQLCFPIGILPCCTLLGTCGCTWAPGAYCL